MSETGGPTAVGAMLLVLLAVSPLAAQLPERRKSDSLYNELVVAMRASKEASDTLEARREAIRRRRDSRIEAGGRVVRFSHEELRSADTAAVEHGLIAGNDRLRERFGPEWADRLIDKRIWVAVSSKSSSNLRSDVTLRATESGASAYTMLRRPIDPQGVERFVLRVAADQLLEIVPSLKRFVRSDLSLADEPDRWPRAAREMAFSWAAAGRRCAIGVVAACEAVMTLRAPDGSTPDWLDPSDTRAAVTQAETPPGADSAMVVDRKACFRGEAARCESVFRKIVVKDPFSPSLRATLVMHAIDRGGRDALTRLAASHEATALANLAAAAATTPDDLLRTWQARTAEALRADRGSSVPLVVTTFAWCALLLAATTRRRP